MNKKYIKLGDLEVYQLSLELSDVVWGIFEKQDWQIKKVVGDQFVRSVDSIGANIAEGYGRYHHKDKIKFYYNARGSLLEAKHWTLLHNKRNLLDNKSYKRIIDKLNILHKKLNSYISSCCKQVK